MPRLSWSPIDGATGYVVYKHTSENNNVEDLVNSPYWPPSSIIYPDGECICPSLKNETQPSGIGGLLSAVDGWSVVGETTNSWWFDDEPTPSGYTDWYSVVAHNDYCTSSFSFPRKSSIDPELTVIASGMVCRDDEYTHSANYYIEGDIYESYPYNIYDFRHGIHIDRIHFLNDGVVDEPTLFKLFSKENPDDHDYFVLRPGQYEIDCDIDMDIDIDDTLAVVRVDNDVWRYGSGIPLDYSDYTASGITEDFGLMNANFTLDFLVTQISPFEKFGFYESSKFENFHFAGALYEDDILVHKFSDVYCTIKNLEIESHYPFNSSVKFTISNGSEKREITVYEGTSYNFTEFDALVIEENDPIIIKVHDIEHPDTINDSGPTELEIKVGYGDLAIGRKPCFDFSCISYDSIYIPGTIVPEDSSDEYTTKIRSYDTTVAIKNVNVRCGTVSAAAELVLRDLETKEERSLWICKGESEAQKTFSDPLVIPYISRLQIVGGKNSEEIENANILIELNTCEPKAELPEEDELWKFTFWDDWVYEGAVTDEDEVVKRRAYPYDIQVNQLTFYNLYPPGSGLRCEFFRDSDKVYETTLPSDRNEYHENCSFIISKEDSFNLKLENLEPSGFARDITAGLSIGWEFSVLPNKQKYFKKKIRKSDTMSYEGAVPASSVLCQRNYSNDIYLDYTNIHSEHPTSSGDTRFIYENVKGENDDIIVPSGVRFKEKDINVYVPSDTNLTVKSDYTVSRPDLGQITNPTFYYEFFQYMDEIDEDFFESLEHTYIFQRGSIVPGELYREFSTDVEIMNIEITCNWYSVTGDSIFNFVGSYDNYEITIPMFYNHAQENEIGLIVNENDRLLLQQEETGSAYPLGDADSTDFHIIFRRIQ